jgi:hypothetical protein
MRRRLFQFLILVPLVALSTGGIRLIYRNNSQNIALHPLPLFPDARKDQRVGALTFLNAWELGSGNFNFGGLSALVALNDGRFIGLSDAGSMIGFGLTQDAKADRPFIAALPGAFGRNVSFKDRDTEGMTYDPQTGRIWVSYESNPAIRRFPSSMARVDGVARPAIIRKWQGNSGGEAFVRLTDGRFLLFSEEQELPDGSMDAIAFSGDPVEPATTAFRFSYRPPAGYLATDATALPDGRVLLLNRRIAFPDGFSAKLTVLDPAEIEQGVPIKGRTIATLKAPLLVDNMEGITLTREGKKIIVWMISDNNFNIFQRTVLMKFTLDLPMKKPEAAETAPGFESL